MTSFSGTYEKIRVLVVDDSAFVRRALTKILEHDPRIEVIGTAWDGREAIEKIPRMKPDVVTMDINMPKMNGLEFLQVLKQDTILKKIPVIVLTTSKNEQDKLESFRLGVAGYMIKPVDYQQFVEVVRAINLYWTLSEMPDED